MNMLDNIIEHILGTPLQVSPLVMTLDGTTKGNAISKRSTEGWKK